MNRNSNQPRQQNQCDTCQEVQENNERVREEVACVNPNEVVICGTVTYRREPVHLATVVITCNRQIVAECITDCKGYYEFRGKKLPYCLRAHKNRRCSMLRRITRYQNNQARVDFVLR